MSVATLLRPRLILVAVLALLLSSAVYGYAASNTVDATNAGDGFDKISGYTVTGISYTLNATDPSKIDSVAFTVTPDDGGTAPSHVQVQIGADDKWFAATGSGAAWSVSLAAANPVITVDEVDNLRIVAAQ